MRRSPGFGASTSWTWQEIRDLEVEAIADVSCFVFLWYETFPLHPLRRFIPTWYKDRDTCVDLMQTLCDRCGVAECLDAG